MNIVNLSDRQQFSGEKMKKNNMFQTPRFFCDIYCFEPGQEQKGHIHGEQDKVYLVLEGQGTFQVGSEKQVLGPGQGTLAPAGTFSPMCSKIVSFLTKINKKSLSKLFLYIIV